MPLSEADALHMIARCLESPNESDSNGENANVVDGLFAIARSLDRVAMAFHDMNGSLNVIAART
jgi:hypothetical protein